MYFIILLFFCIDSSVKKKSCDDNDTFGDLLIERSKTYKVKDIGDDLQKEYTTECSKHGTNTTGKAGAADYGCCDRIQFHSITTMNDPGSLLKVAMNTTLKVLNGEDYDEFVDAGTGVIDSSNVADYVDDSLAFAAMK